ncbi:hypothetical protein KEM60_00169 [Austwickia sp. TVS 96-490-7B]|nr:hypothetical protein [Austwickia sp. TVS 96-490-7B]
MSKNYRPETAVFMNFSAQGLASISCFMVSITSGSRTWLCVNFVITFLFAVAARKYFIPSGNWNPDPRRNTTGGTLLRILLASTLCLAVFWHRPIGGLMGFALLFTGIQGAMGHLKRPRKS